MKRISETEVETTPFEGVLHREFDHRLDQGASVADAVGTLVEDLDGFSENDLLHEAVDVEFWCWLSDTDRVHSGVGEGLTPRATDWFWHSSGMWIAVVGADAQETWWGDAGKSPEGAPEQWRRPIYLWPADGLPLIYRDPEGKLVSVNGRE